MTKLERRLRRAVRELVRAAVDNSWKGSGDPDDIPLIEAEYERAQRACAALIADVCASAAKATGSQQ